MGMALPHAIVHVHVPYAYTCTWTAIREPIKLESFNRPRRTGYAKSSVHDTTSRDLVRRCLRLRRLPCIWRRARQGVDHSGQADFECERWFYIDAGLLKILPQGVPLAHPDEAVKVVKKS
jgi:hypothetical protein